MSHLNWMGIKNMFSDSNDFIKGMIFDACDINLIQLSCDTDTAVDSMYTHTYQVKREVTSEIDIAKAFRMESVTTRILNTKIAELMDLVITSFVRMRANLHMAISKVTLSFI